MSIWDTITNSALFKKDKLLKNRTEEKTTTTQVAEPFTPLKNLANQFMAGIKTIQPPSIEPEVRPTYKEVTQRGTEAFKDIGRLARTVVQQTARSGGALALEIMGKSNIGIGVNRLIPTIEKPEFELPETSSKIEKTIFNTIFGEGKLVGFKGVGEQTLVGIGAEKLAQKSGVSFAIGALIAGLDFTTGGGKDDVLKAIVKINKVDDAIKLARQINVADDLIETFAEEVVKAKNIDEATKLVNNIENIQKTTKTTTQGITETTKIEKPIIQEVIRATETGMTIKPNTWNKFKNWMSGKMTTLKEYAQDDWRRVEKLQQQEGVKIIDDLDPYSTRKRFFGRVGARLEDTEKEIQRVVDDVVSTEKKLDTPKNFIRDEVNEYLRALHTEERNLRLGERATGITTKEAKGIISSTEASPFFKDIQRITTKVKLLNQKTLDILLDGGVISQEFYDNLRKTYKNHVPLQRVFEETEDIERVIAGGKGYDVKGTGIIRAKGSERKVADILGNVDANVRDAIIRVEKNKVDLATLNFARSNPELYGKGKLFEEITPPRVPVAKVEGKIIYRPQPLAIREPNVLFLRENGEPVYLRINDKRLAVAFKGVNREKINGLMRVIGSFTRFMAGLATRFNPEFVFSNKIRDLQETAVYLMSQKGMGIRGTLKTFAKDPQSIKGVVDWLRGKSTEMSKLYNQMRLDGGTTGGMALSTRKAVTESVDELFKIARNNPRKYTKKIIQTINDWNTIFEDSTRLSVYRGALDRGISRGRAATLAKEASIDFNKMGTGGPVINALYMFSNASIQGSFKLLKAMKNPKTAGIVLTGIGSSVFVVNEWNKSIDPNWDDKVSKWDKLNSINVVLPTKEGFKYISIPISWGLKPIKVGFDYTFQALDGKIESVKEMVTSLISATFDAYNPIGGTDITSALTPTFLDIPIDIARNRAWSGSMIKPDITGELPKSRQYFQGLKESVAGKVSIEATKKLSEAGIELSPADVNYAYSQIIGGAGRFVDKFVNSISSVVQGEAPQAREIPVTSRFYRSKSQEELDSIVPKYSPEYKRALQDKSKEKFDLKEQVRKVYEENQKLIKEGKDSASQHNVDNLTDEEYEAYKELKATDKRRQTYRDEYEIYPFYQEVQKLKNAGRLNEAQQKVDILTDEEYEIYKKLKNKLE